MQSVLFAGYLVKALTHNYLFEEEEYCDSFLIKCNINCGTQFLIDFRDKYMSYVQKLIIIELYIQIIFI